MLAWTILSRDKMHACHDGANGSHFGRDKTLSKVSNLLKIILHKELTANISCVFLLGITIILLDIDGKGYSRVLQVL